MYFEMQNPYVAAFHVPICWSIICFQHGAPPAAAYLTWVKRRWPTAGLATISRSVHGPTPALILAQPTTRWGPPAARTLALDAAQCKSHEEAIVDKLGWFDADYRVVSCRCLREDPY